MPHTLSDTRRDRDEDQTEHQPSGRYRRGVRRTNCGSTAAKKTMLLGFDAPTTNPSRRTRAVRPPSVGGVSSTPETRRRCRMVWTPRHTR